MKFPKKSILGARVRLHDGTVGSIFSQTGDTYILFSRGVERVITVKDVMEIGMDVRHRVGQLSGAKYVTMASL